MPVTRTTALAIRLACFDTRPETVTRKLKQTVLIIGEPWDGRYEQGLQKQM